MCACKKSVIFISVIVPKFVPSCNIDLIGAQSYPLEGCILFQTIEM